MKSTFTVRFYLRTNQINKEGKAAIMVRICVNGEKVAFNSKIMVSPEMWDTKGGKVSGFSKEAKQLNRTLDDIRNTISSHYYEIERYDSMVSAEKVRNAFLGVTVRTESIVHLFKEYMDECEALEGISRSHSTEQKYRRCYTHVQEFLKIQYNLTDLPIIEIGHKFVVDFECYLRTVCGCNANTSAKFLQTFRMIIIRAKNNGYLKVDPFANYQIRIKRVDRGYLTQDELDTIASKEFSTKRLERVRDIFIFSCYTGLAYIDIKELKPEHIQKSFNGKMWIMTHRHKTKTTVNVPLLDIPQSIIKKYSDQCKDGQLLPVPSNQKTNQYLNEIADVCGIEKKITFHMARHTFATTVTLAQGVPIESVSKMLGHTNIQATQIYARITNEKISRDMDILAAKMKKEVEQAEPPKKKLGRPRKDAT